MREIECSLEASNYLMDSWPYTEPVLRALIALRAIVAANVLFLLRNLLR